MKWLVAGQDSAVGPGGVPLSQLLPDSTRQALLANLTEEQKHQLADAFDPRAGDNIWLQIKTVRHPTDRWAVLHMCHMF